MKTCVLFCAAEFDFLEEKIGKDDLVIAADGGLRHTKKLGIHPHVVLGDFDSLGYVPEEGKVFPVEKDDTDAMLAVRCGLSSGCGRFLIYGGVDGPRLDHTVANFQLLQYLADHDARGYLVGKDYLITVVKNGSISFPARAEGLISVFCMGKDAEGVTMEGLQYQLRDGTLTSGYPLGVSNAFVGEESRISVKDGSLLILYPRGVGVPEEWTC